jgi:hypothetical protein
MGSTPETLTTITDEPEQTVALQSNLVVTAAAGLEATIDFYQLSPAALSVAQRTQSETAPVEAVLRVDIRPSLLVGILDEIRKIRPQLDISALEGLKS